MAALHHPSDDLLGGFATGGLPLGPSLAVGLHVDACARCAATVRRLEEAEWDLIAALPGAEMSPGALQGVMARLDERPPQRETSRDTPLPGGVVPPPAIAEIGLANPIHLAPEAWVAHLDAARAGGWRTYLFCAPAETPLPRHGHLGDELIVVLEGAFSDGRTFSVGDFAENPAGFVHSMQVTAAGRLVALISSGGAIDWNPADRGIGALLDI